MHCDECIDKTSTWAAHVQLSLAPGSWIMNEKIREHNTKGFWVQWWISCLTSKPSRLRITTNIALCKFKFYTCTEFKSLPLLNWLFTVQQKCLILKLWRSLFPRIEILGPGRLEEEIDDWHRLISSSLQNGTLKEAMFCDKWDNLWTSRGGSQVNLCPRA